MPGVPIWIATRIVPGAAAAGGWWVGFSADLVGAWDALVAADYAASKVDLSGNGNDLVEINGAVTWDATDGWQFAAANTDAFVTQVTPANSSFTMMVQFTDANAGACAIGVLGGLDGCSDYSIAPDGTGLWGDVVHYHHGNERNVATKLVSGTLALSEWQGYRNGSADGSAIASGTPTYLYPMGLGCGVRRYTASKIYDFWFDGNIQRAAVWSAALDASTIAAIHAAWTA